MDSDLEILELRKQITACTKCKLHLGRNKAVPGEGPTNCEVMFIGEAPGFHENEQGKPFVGAAGHFLDTLLEKGGLQRNDVFITNVVKCRPPANRDPEPDELEACDAYLNAQITALNPRVIVTLGRYSMAKFFPNGKISLIHGHSRIINGRLVVPMYHPAAALHQGALKETLLEDFGRLPGMITRTAESNLSKERPSFTPIEDVQEKNEEQDKPTQLSLFG